MSLSQKVKNIRGNMNWMMVGVCLWCFGASVQWFMMGKFWLGVLYILYGLGNVVLLIMGETE